MEKYQLDNLIKFCFLFHKESDNNWTFSSKDYILEKWKNYINVSPIKNESLSYKLIKESYKDFLRSPHTLNNSVFGQIKNVENILTCAETWGIDNYNEVKEIIHFIIKINEKSLKYLSVSDFIIIFEEWIGSPTQISKVPYSNLHQLLRMSIDNWLSEPDIRRDYSLNTLI
jgi:hypothetical protein